MANVCCGMLMNDKVSADDKDYCLRVMAGAIVLFDHVDVSPRLRFYVTCKLGFFVSAVYVLLRYQKNSV